MVLARAGTVTLVTVLVTTIGAALAQNPPPKANPKVRVAKGAAPAPGGGAAPGQGAAPKAVPVDPLVPDAQAKAWTPGTYHYTLRLNVSATVSLATTYYPSKLGINASVVLLIHEKDRSSKDFEEPIADLKGEGLAEYLQREGHAVLAIDLRGQGANVHRQLTPQDWQAMVYDLQAAYWFLVDRANRGELNLSKLAVMGLGEGANLVAAWAQHPGAAVSGQDRISDLAALILISPMADGEGLLLGTVLKPLVQRYPVLVMVGRKDQVSSDPVMAVRSIVENPLHKQNKVQIFDSSLHGYKLLRLEPTVTSVIKQFLEGNAKFRSVEWEPRYNLAPISFSEVMLVRNLKAADAAKAAPAAAPAAPAPAPAKAVEKDKVPAK
jgi:alpha-beta hydrolase superfamily lysophospholipase